MTDVWAASLFANSSAEEDSGSKALRAARAHAWGGDCPLTHPSLTFPTWSPVKRIDMMCGARAARATSSHTAYFVSRRRRYAQLHAPGGGGLVAADAWTDARCPLTCNQKRRKMRPLL